MFDRISSVKGEFRERIAGAIEADDEAVAHEVVATHPVEVDEVAHENRLRRRGGGEEQREEQRDAQDHLRKLVSERRDRRAVTA